MIAKREINSEVQDGRGRPSYNISPATLFEHSMFDLDAGNPTWFTP